MTRIAGELQAHRTLDQVSLQELLKVVPVRAKWKSDMRWIKKCDPVSGEYYESVE